MNATSSRAHTYTHIHIYIYIYIHVSTDVLQFFRCKTSARLIALWAPRPWTPPRPARTPSSQSRWARPSRRRRASASSRRTLFWSIWRVPNAQSLLARRARGCRRGLKSTSRSRLLFGPPIYLSIYLYLYIYLYMYICLHISISMYIYIYRVRLGHCSGGFGGLRAGRIYGGDWRAAPGRDWD